MSVQDSTPADIALDLHEDDEDVENEIAELELRLEKARQRLGSHKNTSKGHGPLSFRDHPVDVISQPSGTLR